MAGKELKPFVKYVTVGSTIAFTLAGSVIGGYFLGALLDRKLSSEPLLTIALMMSGVVLGVIYLVITLRKLGEEKNE